MTIGEFQKHIETLYGERDETRGTAGTFLWLVEEMGELAEGIRTGSRESMEEEFADVLAWLVSVANLEGIDMEKAVAAKYGSGCPKCEETPCRCKDPTQLT